MSYVSILIWFKAQTSVSRATLCLVLEPPPLCLSLLVPCCSPFCDPSRAAPPFGLCLKCYLSALVCSRVGSHVHVKVLALRA